MSLVWKQSLSGFSKQNNDKKKFLKTQKESLLYISD